MKPLSPRQQSILNRVVDTHIETAQPVGSQTITSLYAQLYRSSYSSATVRHEMGLLEDMGYLTHPHTSAGRVPTDIGYRYYVDHSLQNESLPAEMTSRLRENFGERDEQDALAEKAGRILAGLSNEVSLIVLVSRSRKGYYRVFLQGSSHLLEKPEFQDLQKIKILFKAFEEKGALASWLQEKTSRDDGVSVSIGRENDLPALKECSIVAAPCASDDETLGTVAVIGPCRMRYSRAVPLVRQMGHFLGRAFKQAGAGE